MKTRHKGLGCCALPTGHMVQVVLNDDKCVGARRHRDNFETACEAVRVNRLRTNRKARKHQKWSVKPKQIRRTGRAALKSYIENNQTKGA